MEKDRIFVVGGTGQHIIGSLFHLRVLLEGFIDRTKEPKYEIILLDMDKGSDDEKKESANSEVKSYKEYYEVQEDIIPIPRQCYDRYGKFKELNSLLGIKAEYFPLFFDSEQLNVEIKKGMFGQSAVGSILFEEKFRFKEDKNDIIKIMKPDQTAKSNNIFVIGSCVGGTGSGVMPELIRRIANENSQLRIYAIPFMRWFKLIEKGGNSENQRKADNRNNLMKANEQTALVVYKKLAQEFEKLKVIPVGFDDNSLNEREREWSGDFAQPAYFDWVHLNVAEIIRRISMGVENVNENFLAIVADTDGNVGNFEVFIDKDRVKLSDLILANIKLIEYSSTLNKVKEILGRRISFFGKPKEVEYLNNLKIDKDLIEKKKNVLLKLKEYKGKVCINLEDSKTQINELDEQKIKEIQQNTREIQKLWEEFFKYCEKSESKDIIKFIQSTYMGSPKDPPQSSKLFVPSPHDSEIKSEKGNVGRLLKIEANLLDKLADISWTLPSARAERRALPNWYSDVLLDESVLKSFCAEFLDICKRIANNNFDESKIEQQVKKRIFYWFLLLVDYFRGKCFIDDSANIVESNEYFRRNWKIGEEEIKCIYIVKNDKNDLWGYTDPAVFFVPSEHYIKNGSLPNSGEELNNLFREIIWCVQFIEKVFFRIDNTNLLAKIINENCSDDPPPWYKSLKEICYSNIFLSNLANEIKQRLDSLENQNIICPNKQIIDFPVLFGKRKIENKFKWFARFENIKYSKISTRKNTYVILSEVEKIVDNIKDRKEIFVNTGDIKNIESIVISEEEVNKRVKAVLNNRVVYKKFVGNSTEEQNIILIDELVKNALSYGKDKNGYYISSYNHKIYLNLSYVRFCSMEDIISEIFSEKILAYSKDNRTHFLTTGFNPDFLYALQGDIAIVEDENRKGLTVKLKLNFLNEEVTKEYKENDFKSAPGFCIYEKEGVSKPVVMSIYPSFYYRGFKNYYFRYYIDETFPEIDKYRIRLIIEKKDNEKTDFIFSDYINLREADNISIYSIINKALIDKGSNVEVEKNAYFIPKYIEFIKIDDGGNFVSYGVHIIEGLEEYETSETGFGIAFDFGTSNSLACLYRAKDQFYNVIDKDAEKVVIQNDGGIEHSAKNSLWILPYYKEKVEILPSVLAIDKSDKKKIGLVNNAFRNEKKYIYAREFKLNDINLLLREGVGDFQAWGISLRECKVYYLRMLLENIIINYIKSNRKAFLKVEEVKASMPDRLMLGSGRDGYIKVIEEVLTEISKRFAIDRKGEIKIVPESDISLNHIDNNEILVLADLGGGTFDISIQYFGEKLDNELLFFDSYHMGGEFLFNLIEENGDYFIPENIRRDYENKNKEKNNKMLLLDYLGKEESLVDSLFKNYEQSVQYENYKELTNTYFDGLIEYLAIQIFGFILKVRERYKDIKDISMVVYLSGRGWLLKSITKAPYCKSENLMEEIKSILENKLKKVFVCYNEKEDEANKYKVKKVYTDYIKEGKKKLVDDLCKHTKGTVEREKIDCHGILGCGLKSLSGGNHFDKKSFVPIIFSDEKGNDKITTLSDFISKYSVMTDDILNYEFFKEKLTKYIKRDLERMKKDINKIFEKQLNTNNSFILEKAYQDGSLAVVSSPLTYVFEDYVKDMMKDQVLRYIKEEQSSSKKQ